MEVSIRDLPKDSLDDHPCFKHGGQRTNAMTKNWLRKVYSKFGPCVKVGYVDGEPVALIQYAPMDIFPHVDKPEGHRTIVIHCIFITNKEYMGKGMAKRLMESLLQDLRKPQPYLTGGKFDKIVALAGRGRPGPAGPLEFFLKMGFTTVRQISKNDVLVQIEL